MATTTEFQEWLDNLDETNTEEMYNLHESILHEAQMGSFICTKTNDQYFVKDLPTNETLMLASEKAKSAFLKKLNEDYAPYFGEIEVEMDFVRAMRKND